MLTPLTAPEALTPETLAELRAIKAHLENNLRANRESMEALRRSIETDEARMRAAKLILREYGTEADR